MSASPTSSSTLLTTLALLFTAYSLFISLFTFIRPLSGTRLFGLAPPPSALKDSEKRNDPILPFINVFAGRNLALGVAGSISFAWMGMWSSVGVVLACCCISGAVDKVVMGQYGLPGKAWGHGGGTAVMGVIAWLLVVSG